MPPKKIEGATEAHAGSGAWFEKHVAENGTVECFSYPQPMRVGLHIVGHLKNQFDIVSLELVNREDVGAAKIHCATFLRCFSFILRAVICSLHHLWTGNDSVGQAE